MAGIIAPGTPAPELRLTTEDGDAFTEEDLKGRTTVLVFYPFAFSPVCTDQFQIYEEVLTAYDWPGAASLTIVLSVSMLALVALALWATGRRARPKRVL